MAVSPMLKVTVYGHLPALDEVLATLQRAGAVDVVSADAGTHGEVGYDDERRFAVEGNHADASFTRDFLARFHESDAPLSTFVAEKVHLTAERYGELRFDKHAKRLYLECVGISDHLSVWERERGHLVSLIHDLEPWNPLHLQIAHWRNTDRTRLFAGIVSTSSADQLRERLRATTELVTITEVSRVGERQAWLIMALDEAADDVRAVLSGSDFSETSFPDLEDYPAEETARAKERIEEIDAASGRLRERAEELARHHYHDAVALVQALESGRSALLLRDDVAANERTFVATGWVEKRRTDELRDALQPLASVLDVDLREPEEDEEPPVALVNPLWLRPFEILTDLYGRPAYRGTDPTPLHAPFFLLFFALCIGDVGYGAMLIGGAWLVKHKLDVTEGVKRFMDLLMMGGALSMVVGVFLGSYLALPVDSLPPFLQSLQVLDPIEDIQQFLLVALVIGVVQVFFGVFVAAYLAFRRGDKESAVFDQLSIVFLFVMLALTAVGGAMGNSTVVRGSLVIGLVGAMVMQGRAVQSALRADEVASWDRLLGIVWVGAFVGGFFVFGLTGSLVALWVALGVSGLGLLVSKAVRRGVVGVLSGAYNVYGLTGFVGDVLSYLRLPALGLSGTLVGSVFNILTNLVWSGAAPLFESGGFAWLGGAIIALLAVAVFAVGHTFNVVINLLGAFVHPTRLQFVEFFSKFYEAGGRPFAPFSLRTDGLVLDAGAAGEEGGRVS